MTTELVLLLSMFVLIIGSVFLGPSGPGRVFKTSAPRLGAQLERQLTIGDQFDFSGQGIEWRAPAEPPPLGSPQ